MILSESYSLCRYYFSKTYFSVCHSIRNRKVINPTAYLSTQLPSLVSLGNRLSGNLVLLLTGRWCRKVERASTLVKCAGAADAAFIYGGRLGRTAIHDCYKKIDVSVIRIGERVRASLYVK